MDILLQLFFDGWDGLGSCSCGLPGIFSRRQIIVLEKEDFCMNDPGRFLRDGRRKECRI